MLICITSKGDKMTNMIDKRFGRAEFFIFYDTEKETAEGVKNPYIQASGGAGTQAAQFVVEKGTEAVLTCNVGPKACRVL